MSTKLLYTLVFLSFSFLFNSCSYNSEQSTVSVENQAGKTAYDKTCVACHLSSGKGVPGAFPPLAESGYLIEDPLRSIRIIINGLEGEIIVNGQQYSNSMPPQVLTDKEIRDVMNYILNSWGNVGGTVTLSDVQSQK